MCLSKLMKRSIKKKFFYKKFVMTKEALELFYKLKCFFACAPMLVDYNLIHLIIFECDASGFAIEVIPQL